ncbi:MAG: hypothetical protein RLZZ373_3743 [Pseudomonadota bacterium]
MTRRSLREDVPECGFCDAPRDSVERVGRVYVCSCCGRSWRVLEDDEPVTDLLGNVMDED